MKTISSKSLKRRDRIAREQAGMTRKGRIFPVAEAGVRLPDIGVYGPSYNISRQEGSQ